MQIETSKSPNCEKSRGSGKKNNQFPEHRMGGWQRRKTPKQAIFSDNVLLYFPKWGMYWGKSDQLYEIFVWEFSCVIGKAGGKLDEILKAFINQTETLNTAAPISKIINPQLQSPPALSLGRNCRDLRGAVYLAGVLSQPNKSSKARLFLKSSQIYVSALRRYNIKCIEFLMNLYWFTKICTK